MLTVCNNTASSDVMHKGQSKCLFMRKSMPVEVIKMISLTFINRFNANNKCIHVVSI